MAKTNGTTMIAELSPTDRALLEKIARGVTLSVDPKAEAREPATNPQLLVDVTRAIGNNLNHDGIEATLSEHFDTIDSISWNVPGKIHLEGTRDKQLVDIVLRVESIVIGSAA